MASVREPVAAQSIGRTQAGYRARTPKSRAAFARNQVAVPGGVPGGLGVMLPYPLSIERAEGCHVPDTQWGEVVCAAVVMGGDLVPPGVSEVGSFLEDKLATYKHPRRVLAVDAIPRTPATGQIKRALLRHTLTDGDTGGI